MSRLLKAQIKDAEDALAHAHYMWNITHSNHWWWAEHDAAVLCDDLYQELEQCKEGE